MDGSAGRVAHAVVQPVREDDFAVARLLYTCSPGRATFLAGDPSRALRLVVDAIRHRGTESSRDVLRIVKHSGDVCGAISTFVAAERHLRRRRLVALALRRRPPWHWPGLVRASLASMKASDDVPPDTIYIDALATDERFRRQGVAAALLENAIVEARQAGFRRVALHTHESNVPAHALYRNAGFDHLEPPRPGELMLFYRDLRD